MSLLYEIENFFWDLFHPTHTPSYEEKEFKKRQEEKARDIEKSAYNTRAEEAILRGNHGSFSSFENSEVALKCRNQCQHALQIAKSRPSDSIKIYISTRGFNVSTSDSLGAEALLCSFDFEREGYAPLTEDRVIDFAAWLIAGESGFSVGVPAPGCIILYKRGIKTNPPLKSW